MLAIPTNTAQNEFSGKVLSLSNSTDDHLIKLYELYASIRGELRHLVSQKQLLEHSRDCPATKRHRILVLIGAMLTGAGVAGGFILKTFL